MAVLVFCDESWTQNPKGRKVGTLGAIMIPARMYNDLCDRVFSLATKYFGHSGATDRKFEIKGKRLLTPYEYRREIGGKFVSMKLSFARELLEELRARKSIRVFGSVVFARQEVDLLCEDADRLDRPYVFLMERLQAALEEGDEQVFATVAFDDRGISANERVGEAYTNFLSKSPFGRAFSCLIRTPVFAYSRHSIGIQLADLVSTVISRYHTDKRQSHRVPEFWGILRGMVWSAKSKTPGGHQLNGIKVIGERQGARKPIQADLWAQKKRDGSP